MHNFVERAFGCVVARAIVQKKSQAEFREEILSILCSRFWYQLLQPRANITGFRTGGRKRQIPTVFAYRRRGIDEFFVRPAQVVRDTIIDGIQVRCFRKGITGRFLITR